MGTFAFGIVVIVVATYLLGPIGLLIAILSVGSWWIHKFWPRSPAPAVPEAQDFLQSLEKTSREAGYAERSEDPLRDIQL
jgi:hypothetical protein